MSRDNLYYKNFKRLKQYHIQYLKSMQVRPTPSKPKYKIKDFAVPGSHATNKQSYSIENSNCNLYCICKQFSKNQTKRCNRCSANYHNCVAKSSQETNLQWECLHCHSYYMDPIFTVDSILLETFFKTDSVYQYANFIEFNFTLNSSQMNNPVQIRCLQDSRGGVLAWPMQGQFYLNQQQFPEAVIDFKPLLFNSNRKHRKEESLLLPANRLKQGANVLTYKVPRLNSQTFGHKYQCEERAVYFIGIYSIKKLTKEQLISKTIKKNRIDKQTSLKLLKKLTGGDSELEVEKIKLCLQCPYTKSRIKIPIRGKNCTHYMCLCLDTLIQTRMGMNSREWSCPICSNRINEPIIDNFILSMLNDGSAGIEVMLSISGEYNWVTYADQQIDLDSQSDDIPIKSKQPEQKKIESKKLEQKKPIETIELDDSPPPPQNKLPELQIMIPQDLQPLLIQPSEVVEKRHSKNRQKGKKNKGSAQIYKYQGSQPNKQAFIITDIKEIDFRPMNHGQFNKKYFMIQPLRAKVHDDLRNIFKEVL